MILTKNNSDSWFFTGAKAMNGTFNNAVAVDGDSVNPPYTTTLPDTTYLRRAAPVCQRFKVSRTVFNTAPVQQSA